jgi:Flp pilus assembly protein TadB
MTDSQAHEAQKIIADQQARLEELEKELKRHQGHQQLPPPLPNVGGGAPGTSDWHIGAALGIGLVLGLIAWAWSEANRVQLDGLVGNADFGEFLVVGIASMIPMAVLFWDKSKR